MNLTGWKTILFYLSQALPMKDS